MRFPDQLKHLFPSATKQNWLDRISADLKGSPISSLDWKPVVGQTLSPFFCKEGQNTAPATVLPASQNWEIGEDIPLTDDFHQANSLSLEALEGGAQSLRFLCGGTTVLNGDNLTVLLREIDYSFVSLHFLFQNIESAQALLQGLLAIVPAPRAVRGSLGIAQNCLAEPILLNNMAVQLTQLPNFRWAVPVGAGDFQGDLHTTTDLARLLGKAEVVLGALLQLGLTKGQVASMIQLTVPIGLDYFVNIAKIRALKCLWGNVLNAHGLPPSPPFLDAYIAEDTWVADPNKNMLRATTQAMSAVIGGADRLTIPPFENQSERFGRRIARNIQHVAQLESHLDWVQDPAAGSYFVEQLTATIVEETWREFSK